MTFPARAERFSRTRWPGTLRPYQVSALATLEERWASGRDRAWVVLPPGAGKTLVGLEAARRLGRQTVIFVPNTAIQHQWVRHWKRFSPTAATAGTRRALDTDVCVLTYQSLAVFDPDQEIDEEGHELPGRDSGLLGRLHRNGRELIATLAAAGPLTLVLDECHHLLDLWGRLVAEVLEQLPDAVVIGLTATPPGSLTTDEAELVDVLFGVPILGASIPALVRQEFLAAFAELAWLTPPTAVETAYITAEAERFAELTTDLLDPEFAPTGFLSWLDARFVQRDAGGAANTGDARRASEVRKLAWGRLEKDRPELSAAALRLHHAGLLALPPGARLREEHRHEPTADDWVELLGDYVKHCLLAVDDDRNTAAVEAIRRALPAVGYQLTKRGIRAARSPVDRVLARSAAKTYGAVEITATEAAALGDRLRCLVLCDHERVSARLPARLTQVLDSEAGSAWLMLENLVTDARTRELDPMLVTGRTVAAAPDTARRFAGWVSERDPTLTLALAGTDGLATLTATTGSWSSRVWVPLVTEFFAAGCCKVLVGTRALLGEGWDAQGVNALIDLTTATTPTSVVQTRGRVLRRDPAWPGKVANTWTVVCLTDRHPKGGADWHRFVRKHAGYLAATTAGEIVSGVAHVDATFSPYAPPPVADCDAVNATMLERARDREATRATWGIGTEFRDALVHTIRVRPDRRGQPVPVATAGTARSAPPRPPAIVPTASGAVPVPVKAPARAVRGTGTALTAIAGLSAALTDGPGSPAARLVLASLAGLALTFPLVPVVRAAFGGWAGRRLEQAAGEPSLSRFAYAVADALAATGLSRRGADAVEVRVDADGSYRFSLSDVDTAVSERFATALDELLSPMAAPRYVVPRYVLRPRSGRSRRARGRAWLRGTVRADGVVYHAVPAVLAQNRRRATAFAAAWNIWVSAGQPLYTGTPEGEGVLVTHRGADPLAATTVLRVAWS